MLRYGLRRGRPKKHELVVGEAQRAELERLARQSRSARSVAFERVLPWRAGGASNAVAAAKVAHHRLRLAGFGVTVLLLKGWLAWGIRAGVREHRAEIGDEKVEQVRLDAGEDAEGGYALVQPDAGSQD